MNLKAYPTLNLDSFSSFLKRVYSEEGFSTGSLINSDLNKMRSIVQKHYEKTLINEGKVSLGKVAETPLEEYHKISNLVNHEKLWIKQNRVLSLDLFNELMELDFFKTINETLPEYFISDEEELGFPCITWRLVRPLPFNDVGPIHADEWFWKLGHGRMPKNCSRIKIWFSIFNEKGLNGLVYGPSTHLQNFEYKSVKRHGINKPVFDQDKYDLGLLLFQSSPGDFIMFNDKLLHGGKVGGDKTRISLEFTLIIPNNYLKSIGINLSE